jgi:hypothetical protein
MLPAFISVGSFPVDLMTYQWHVHRLLLETACCQLEVSSCAVRSCRYVGGVKQLCYRAGPHAAAHDQPQPAGHHCVRRANSRGCVPLATAAVPQWRRRCPAAFADCSAALGRPRHCQAAGSTMRPAARCNHVISWTHLAADQALLKATAVPCIAPMACLQARRVTAAFEL